MATFLSGYVGLALFSFLVCRSGLYFENYIPKLISSHFSSTNLSLDPCSAKATLNSIYNISRAKSSGKEIIFKFRISIWFRDATN